MASIKNGHVYAPPEKIKALKEEHDWNGRHVTQIDPKDPGHLIIYVIPPRRRSKKDDDKRKKPAPKKREDRT